MTSAVNVRGAYELTDVPSIVRAAIKLGVLETVMVLVGSFASRFLEGPAELVVLGAIVALGIAAVTVLPGIWTQALTIEGIAGAAAIGLGATVVFMFLDIALLQPIGTYTHRWYQVGGGSNWWYHPIWWMVGTFLPWMGAWALANQRERGDVSVPRLLLSTLALTLVLGAIAAAVRVPLAGWNLPTFAVAALPGLVLAVVLSSLGRRRA
jgi:hypothetical protein